MLREMLSVIVRAMGSFFSYTILLRLIMIYLNIPFHSPIGLFVLSITNPVVLKLRRFMRPLAKLDTASLVAVSAVVVTQGTVLYFLTAGSITNIPIAPLLLASTCKILFILTEIYIFSTTAYAILSWITPGNQITLFFMSIVRPAITFIRRFVRPIANIDISPLLLLLALNVIIVPFKSYIPSWW